MKLFRDIFMAISFIWSLHKPGIRPSSASGNHGPGSVRVRIDRMPV